MTLLNWIKEITVCDVEQQDKEIEDFYLSANLMLSIEVGLQAQVIHQPKASQACEIGLPFLDEHELAIG